MVRTYTSYFLTILSGLLVYFMFAAMSSVAAGITWMPIISFFGSIIHVGISSWLFLIFPKTGKVTAISTAFVMCMWPFAAVIWSLKNFDASAVPVYFLPIGISAVVVWNHLKSFQNQIEISAEIFIILSTVPVAFLVYMVYFYAAMSI